MLESPVSAIASQDTLAPDSPVRHVPTWLLPACGASLVVVSWSWSVLLTIMAVRVWNWYGQWPRYGRPEGHRTPFGGLYDAVSWAMGASMIAMALGVLYLAAAAWLRRPRLGLFVLAAIVAGNWAVHLMIHDAVFDAFPTGRLLDWYLD
ncbi:MAG: hypothetical protein AAF916_01390 [Planctomycetota bacterium]